MNLAKRRKLTHSTGYIMKMLIQFKYRGHYGISEILSESASKYQLLWVALVVVNYLYFSLDSR